MTADHFRTVAAGLARPLLRVLSPGGNGGLSIFIYHRVLAAPDPLFPGEIDRMAFDRHLGFIKAACNVLPLAEAVRLAKAGRLPARAASITFDDGYADNAQEALPILQRHGLCATFFVATGFLDGGRMWNDTVIELLRRLPAETYDPGLAGVGPLSLHDLPARRAAMAAVIGQLKYLPMAQRLERVQRLVRQAALPDDLPDDLMLRSAQVRQLHAAGMEIGAHTVNHPILAAIPPRQAHDEIADGKASLEAIVRAPVRLFAYPNGKPGVDYLPEHVRMVRELGFDGAVSTAWGGRTDDRYQMPRFTPWDRHALRFQLRMGHNLLRRAQTV